MITEEKKWFEEFYGELQALDNHSWPKTCNKCGQKYDDQEDFVAKTAGLSHKTGLGTMIDKEGREYVGLYRNCICGSTLVGKFKNRRDNSEEGQESRAYFDNLLNMLINHGMEREQGRLELLKLLSGEPNEIIKLKA